MRYFAYVEQLANEEHMTVALSEEYVIQEYWPFWYEQMLKKFPPGHKFITKENCLEDWIAAYWAWEIDDPTSD